MTDIVTTSWSEVDASNNQFPPEGWPAGMLPNAVEPTARMNMGAVKRFWNRVNPVYVTTLASTTDTYAATPSQAITGYGLFESWELRPHATNQSTSPTLAISGLPPQPIMKYVASSVTALAAGDISANKPLRFYWDGTRMIANVQAAGIGTNSITNASLAQMAAYTIKGNATSATANAADVAAGSGVTPWGIPTNKNLIQNGDMAIDQGNEGAAVTIPNTATLTRSVDRIFALWNASTSGAGTPTIQQQAASSGLVTFQKSILVTANVTPSTSTPSALNLLLRHAIEGSDVADLAFGTASAAAITISGKIKTSLTNANFGISLANSALNRSYPHIVNIPSANTWTSFSFTVPGDTSGTWLTAQGTLGILLFVTLARGSGGQGTADTWNAALAITSSAQTQFTDTGSATFEMTGLKLEHGSTATPFWSESAAALLPALRRYYRKTFPPGTAPAQSAGVTGAVSIKNPIALGDPSAWVPFEPIMYASPTIVTYNPSAGNANWRNITAGSDATVSVDPGSTKSVNGVLIATNGTVATLGDILGIHYSADAGI